MIWIITIIFSMAVVDHYDHHGGMHTLHLTTRTGRATSEVGGCIRISSPKSIPQPKKKKKIDLYLNDSNRMGYVTSWDYLVIYVLKPLHARMNTLLVFNLFNILYEVSEVY